MNQIHPEIKNKEMNKYRCRTTGSEIEAIQLTEEMLNDPNTLTNMPPGFSVITGNGSPRVEFRAFEGHINQWFFRNSFGEWQPFTSNEQFTKKYIPESFYQEPSEDPRQVSLNFEAAIREAIEEHISKGLTVCEGIGVLTLFASSISHNLFTNQE